MSLLLYLLYIQAKWFYCNAITLCILFKAHTSIEWIVETRIRLDIESLCEAYTFILFTLPISVLYIYVHMTKVVNPSNEYCWRQKTTYNNKKKKTSIERIYGSAAIFPNWTHNIVEWNRCGPIAASIYLMNKMKRRESSRKKKVVQCIVLEKAPMK